MSKIIVTEYPKSGGGWVCNLIGGALSRPCKDFEDIYFQSSKNSPHPWYSDGIYDFTENCIVKNHQPIDSEIFNLKGKTVHLYRDGRDVAVSKYYFDRDFLVINGYTSEFTKNFEEAVLETANEWSKFVLGWFSRGDVINVSYEEFVTAPTKTLMQLVQDLGYEITSEKAELVVRDNTIVRMREKMDHMWKVNNFYRKGIIGDWKNHFSAELEKEFLNRIGEASKYLVKS